MKHLTLCWLWALFLVVPVSGQQKSTFQFKPGQSVFIRAVDVYGSPDANKPDLQLERQIKEEFKKHRKFVIANTEKQADFVFALFLDPTSDEADEVAIAYVSGADATTKSIDELQQHADWRGTEHYHRGKGVAKGALAGATAGASLLFLRSPLVDKELVKRFHKEVLN